MSNTSTTTSGQTAASSSEELPISNYVTKLPQDLVNSASLKQLTVTWKDLNVKVEGGDTAYGDTFLSFVDPRPLFRRTKPPEKVQSLRRIISILLTLGQLILRNLNGQLKPGEMVSAPSTGGIKI
jgi:hypothetical protein